MDQENNASSLRSLIDTEFTELLATLNGDTRVVKEMISIFIHETPLLFENIQTSVNLNKWTEAAAQVHQVKTRYGYFGLESVMEDLDRWENLLLMDIPTDHGQLLSHFKKINHEVSSILKETVFYEPQEKVLEEKLPLSGKKVLIAEDDEINAKVFELFVNETGATVLLATNGQEALEIAMKENPDMIFMDVHMPFYNGLEAIRELRVRGLTCPILSLSASTRLDERQNSLTAGANDFLVKPATRKSITEVLMKYLS